MAGAVFQALLASGRVKTVTFLTTTNVANQTWTVPATWNSADNTVEVISHGANTSGSMGGGGGGYAKKANISLTPGGSATFRLRAGNSDSGTANASWFNGATLAASSVGIQGAGTGTGSGASTTSAIGTTVFAGGNGADDVSGGGGGGAAGPHGAGGNAPGGGPTGGTGDAGNTAAASNGTQFDGSHGAGGGGTGGDTPGAGGLYGGGAGGSAVGSAAGQQALIIITNNASA